MCNISQVGTLLQISCRGLTWLLWLQEAIKQAEEGRKAPLGRLNNMLMQMRNNCNHPDLITSKFDNSPTFPPADVLIAAVRQAAAAGPSAHKAEGQGPQSPHFFTGEAEVIAFSCQQF